MSEKQMMCSVFRDNQRRRTHPALFVMGKDEKDELTYAVGTFRGSIALVGRWQVGDHIETDRGSTYLVDELKKFVGVAEAKVTRLTTWSTQSDANREQQRNPDSNGGDPGTGQNAEGAVGNQGGEEGSQRTVAGSDEVRTSADGKTVDAADASTVDPPTE